MDVNVEVERRSAGALVEGAELLFALLLTTRSKGPGLNEKSESREGMDHQRPYGTDNGMVLFTSCTTVEVDVTDTARSDRGLSVCKARKQVGHYLMQFLQVRLCFQ